MESTAAVNGVQLHVRTIGDGPDVVVLHGGPGAHHDYLLPHFDALATGRRLRYYDQRGGGRSPVTRDVPVGWREHVDDLDALIELWGIAPATLVGYSWGGLLALLYAATRPERVGRLALISPAPLNPEHRAEFERRFAERMAHPQVAGEREALRESGLWEQDPDAYRQRAFVWESVSQTDLRNELTELCELSIPSLVIHGRHDPIPLETAEQVAGCLGASLEVFEDSGHVPYVEDFEEFVQVLDGFLPKQQ